eukprot:m.24161 g.24161  ORF g.24161 m.24161 type:complete len:105 (-) comp6035_c0_seq1:26-340(-)
MGGTRSLTTALVLAMTGGVAALDNGAANTPPLGWCSWQRYRCAISCNDATSPDCFNEVREGEGCCHRNRCARLSLRTSTPLALLPRQGRNTSVATRADREPRLP